MVYALTDFGSTFTKVALVEAPTGRLLATAQHPTTIEDDVAIGFERARAEALELAGLGRVDRALAASSAAGGLRMAAVGLVDDLTAAAARRCALSAGAKVEAVWSGRLGPDETAAIHDQAVDVILFAGGTDGGERDRVLANARAVAAADGAATVVVACNRDVAAEAGRIFEAVGHEIHVVANVLPRVDRECDEPAREAIREVFIGRVVHAKGLSRTAGLLGSVVMPSPAAVLAAAELLAADSAARPARGTVVVVDVGGATTDVHSVVRAAASPERLGRAAPAPARSARTVEGDLGVRWSADTVLGLDAPWLAEAVGAPREALREAVATRRRTPSFVPADEWGRRVDRALATSCATLALQRHVGLRSTRYVPGEGAEVVLDGRDLRDADVLLATGGSLVRDPQGAHDAVNRAVERLDDRRPAPRDARVVVDTSYVLAAAGLLAGPDPNAALALLAAETPGAWTS